MKRVPSVRRHEAVQDKIQERILAGDLNPGDMLLPERELAKMLGVSRPSVRQALVSLESRGLVTVTRRGTYVAESSIGQSLLPVIAAMVNQSDAVLDFIEYRKILEVGGARVAALRAKPGDISAIAGCIQQMEIHIQQGTDPFEPDLQMHIAIAEASQLV
jgi:GntR family transcriptional repressor for pyruvate dehydrogenase complex